MCPAGIRVGETSGGVWGGRFGLGWSVVRAVLDVECDRGFSSAGRWE